MFNVVYAQMADLRMIFDDGGCWRKELGIGALFEKENINTLKMTSEFMIALYGSFAQAESESI